MKKLFISSSSFIFPEHLAWNDLKSQFKLNFQYIGNFSSSLLLKDKNIILACILFATDFFEENHTFYLEDKKVYQVCKPIINLISKKIKNSPDPVIIAMSKYSSFNIINHVYQTPAAHKIFNYILNEIHLLQKKYKNIYFIDLDYKFSNFGFNSIFDKRNWYLANCKISVKGLEFIIEDIKRIINRIYSPARKILVLDCDNTLWGGVVGEVGIDSIILGQDGIGKAYMDFQRTIKSLSTQGVLLAIASKNNEQDVIEVFEKNKFMQIKKEDIITFKVNWNEKSENIKNISHELNLGLDSFVFWDDNAFERDKIRKKLPEVLTPELTDDISYWPDQLRELDDFSKFSKSKDDQKKIKQYRIRSKFINSKKNFSDEVKYLRSIKLKARRININQSNISRAEQLTQKTNQFNLRTVRYTHSEIKKFSANNKNTIFLINLRDIYGDHGIVGILMAKNISKNSIFIENFLMSCRILGRNLETWILRELIKISKKMQILNIYGEYIESKKNIMCKNFFLNHNFKKVTNKKKFNKIFKFKAKGNLYCAHLNDIDLKLSNVYD